MANEFEKVVSQIISGITGVDPLVTMHKEATQLHTLNKVASSFKGYKDSIALSTSAPQGKERGGVGIA